MIKAVIYDLDDVIVNSYPLHAEAFDMFLKEHGCSFSRISEEMSKRFIGMRTSDVTKELINYFGLKTGFKKAYERRTEIFLQLAEKKLELLPGVMHSLELFKGKYRLAIASSGARKYISMVVSKFRLEKYFGIIVSGDDVSKSKPDPEAYLAAASRLGLKPSECAVLEDAKIGVEAAKRAGCMCIAIRNPNTPIQDLSKADAIIDSLQKIDIQTISSLLSKQKTL
ncbi:HAD family phosphatase [Candidatus Woesearchaeota archaeon]|nr:HAD family phosphatase [Candidatus Woesearchaeota archaeon]